MNGNKVLGRHVLIDLNGCPEELLNDIELMKDALPEVVRKAGGTVVDSKFHHFSPYGVTGVVVIQESHLAIHTWPENNFAAIDLFTCSPAFQVEVAEEELKRLFRPENSSEWIVERGAREEEEKIRSEL